VKNRMTGKKSPKPAEELTVCNPMGIKIGNCVSIDVSGFRGKQWRVTQVRALDAKTNPGRRVRQRHFKCVEYALQCDDEKCFLRVWPDPNNSREWIVLLLTLRYDTPWDGDGQGITETCQSLSPDLDFREDNDAKGIHDQFWRVDDNPDSIMADVKVLEVMDGCDKVDARHCQYEYWDFWRNWKLEGVETVQYLYIETNQKTGWVQGKIGQRIEPERVFVN